MLKQLRERLEPVEGSLDDDATADAAVLIPVTDEVSPRIVLTVRATHLHTHAGEIAFPGGKRDPQDATLSATALRESFEEIALDPGAVELIGMGVKRTSRFGLRVRPFVGIIPPDTRMVANREELEALFTVPMSYFLDRGNLRMDTVEHDGRIRDIPWYVWQDRRVWGLTAVMLIDLLNLVFDFGVEMRR